MDVNKRRERAGAEAAEWWLRFEAGDMSREQRGEFVDWLRESAVHVAEFLRVAEVHGALEQFRDWAGVSTEGWDAPGSVVPFSQGRAAPAPAVEARRFTARKRWLAVAAAAAVAAFALWFAIVPRPQVIETGRGERRGVTIADGSVIQIDPQSRLSIRLQADSRHVRLERGRALFRVAKDAKRPFFVEADSTVVRAVGTQFGVEQAREGVVVTVAEGKVSVLPQPIAASRSVSPGINASEDKPAEGSAQLRENTRPGALGQVGREEVILIAGQQVTVPKRGPTYPVRHVDSERELAWAAGRLVFENQSVASVVEEFNRYNVVQLHVADAQLAERAINGVFDASEPESFIGFIKSVVPVRVDRAGADITLSSAP